MPVYILHEWSKHWKRIQKALDRGWSLDNSGRKIKVLIIGKDVGFRKDYLYALIESASDLQWYVTEIDAYKFGLTNLGTGSVVANWLYPIFKKLKDSDLAQLEELMFCQDEATRQVVSRIIRERHDSAEQAQE